MSVEDLLAQQRSEVLEEAYEALERSPTLIAQDILQGRVSAEAAKQAYGFGDPTVPTAGDRA